MMKRSLKTMALFAMTFALGLLPMKVLAEENGADAQVEVETDTQITVLEEDENIRTGTMGDNDGIKWTYDESTKTLTVTGEDSGVYGNGSTSPFKDICGDVETIIFQDCKLIGSASRLLADLQTLKRVDFNNFDTSQITDMSRMFERCSSLTSLDLSSFDTSQITDMRSMFSGCNSLANLDLSGFDTSNVEYMSNMFHSCSSLTSLDLSGFDTSQVTGMGGMTCMFQYCSSLTSLDLSGFDTSQVTYMAGMFQSCSSLTSLDLSNFDTSQVTGMDYMFYDCSSLTNLNLSSFDTSQVASMFGMFQYCSSLTSLDLSSFDTSQVTFDIGMVGMFDGCSSLISLGLGNFDTSQVTNMAYMFQNCSSLTSLDLSSFDTSQVKSMSYMFQNCSSLTNLNLSGFDTSQVTNMNSMFNGCRSLTNLDLSSFDISQETDTQEMLSGCSGLEEIHTPKNMADSQSIALPSAFLDSNNNIVTALTSATCNMILQKKPNPFEDVDETKWYYPYIKYIVDKGLMSGMDTTEDGKIIFKPENNMTREQFVQVLYAKEGKPAVQYTAKFTDVPNNGAWYTNAIMWATEKGVVAGKGEKFGVGDLITREQMATMLFSYANYKGYDTSARAELTGFSDADKVSSWAVPSMQWAVANGIMKGTGSNIKPLSNTSRAEAATMLKAFLETFE